LILEKDNTVFESDRDAQDVRLIDNSERILAMMMAVCICTLSTASIAADESTQNSPQGKNKSSLIEIAPALYKSAMRYHKFYGDENTTDGNILERSYLFGSADGVRDSLVDQGIYVDFGVTQFLQGNVSGGDKTTSSARTNGSADAWLWLDTGKADLWSNGAVFLHGETNWVGSINSDVGSMLPANQDVTSPDADQASALSEWYLLQTFPDNLLMAIGKQNLAAWADNNAFANNERTQFQYTGLINNPLIGSFVPASSLSTWLAWSPSKKHTLIGIFSQTDGGPTESGFDTLFNGDNTYAAEYIYTPTNSNLPGHYHLINIYTSKDATNFQISDRHLIGEAVGAVPVDKKNDNYAVMLNFDQYLWVKDERADTSAERHRDAPIGVGVFARAGWAPEDRNVIDQFYSFGIGGVGMLIPGRDNDNWGIGWSGTHISSDLRDFPVGQRSFEHAVEVFYNFWLMPAAHLSVNSQAIRPADKSADTAYTLGARLQLDF
jgi:porin